MGAEESETAEKENIEKELKEVALRTVVPELRGGAGVSADPGLLGEAVDLPGRTGVRGV